MKRTHLLLTSLAAVFFLGFTTAQATTRTVKPTAITFILVPPLQQMIDSQADPRYDAAAIECAHWILETSPEHISSKSDDTCCHTDREEATTFMVTWMDLTDKIDMHLGREVYPLLECRDVLMAYLAAAMLYAVDTHHPEYSLDLQRHSLLAAINYYQANRAALGSLGGMDLLTHFRDTGALDYYLTQVAPLLELPAPANNIF